MLRRRGQQEVADDPVEQLRLLQVDVVGAARRDAELGAPDAALQLEQLGKRDRAVAVAARRASACSACMPEIPMPRRLQDQRTSGRSAAAASGRTAGNRCQW